MVRFVLANHTGQEGTMSSPLSRVVVAAPFVLTCALSFVLHAQTSSAQKPAQEKPAVKSAPMRTIVSVEGKDNFEAYCAVCHGKDAKGTGPAAPAMKTPVPDLTLIAKRHGGKFDPIEIENTIRGTDKRLPTVSRRCRSGATPSVGPRIRP
jgi:mono/diheme cytochrome c family protein